LVKEVNLLAQTQLTDFLCWVTNKSCKSCLVG